MTDLRSLLFTMIAFAIPTVVVGQVCPAYDPGMFSPAPPLLTAGDDFGSIPAGLSVSDSGDATYRMPLQLPAGPNGMAPGLALQYSSSAGNGVLGVGFSLAGLSSITSCNRGMSQPFNAYNFWLGTKCLDGKPLAMVSDVDGVQEFRTQPNTHVRVRSVGGPGQQQWYYRAWSRDGAVHEYGQNFSDLLVTSARTIFGSVGWPITRSTDLYGNSVDYHYETTAQNHPQTTERRIQRIEYGVDRMYRVSFGYDNRPDPISSVVAGNIQAIDARITRITISKRQGDDAYKRIREYQLAYKATTVTGEPSKLESILLCGVDDSTCTQPTRFAWSLHGSSMHGPYDQDNGPDNFVNPNVTIMAYDTNGDGRDDLVFPTSNTWRVSRSQNTSDPRNLFNDDFQVLGVNYGNDWAAKAVPYDINLDGAMDLLPRSSDVLTHENYAEPWRPIISGVNGGPSSQPLMPDVTSLLNKSGSSQQLDYNGDGLLDVLERYPAIPSPVPPNPGTRSYWLVRTRALMDEAPLFLGPPVEVPELTYFNQNAIPDSTVFVMDSDGDRRDEIFYSKPVGPSAEGEYRLYVKESGQPEKEVRLTGPASIFHNTSVFAGFRVDLRRVVKGDFNGDGLMDLIMDDARPGVIDGRRKWYVAFGAGKYNPIDPHNQDAAASTVVFTPPRRIDYLPTSDYALRHALVTDIDSDGRHDLLVPDTDTANKDWADHLNVLSFKTPMQSLGATVPVATWRLGGFTAMDMAHVSYGAQGPRLADVNGDLQQDVVMINRISPASQKVRVFMGVSGPQDLLTSVREGSNLPVAGGSQIPPTYAIEYAPMTDPALYDPAGCTETGARSCIKRTRHLVKRVRRDTAATHGGRLVEQHEYENGRIDRTTGNWLGFARHIIVQSAEGSGLPPVRIERSFSNDTLQFDPRLTELRVSGTAGGRNWLNVTTYNWATAAFPSTNGVSLNYPYVRVTTDALYEGVGTPTELVRSNTSTVNAIDLYGNVIERLTRNSDNATVHQLITPEINTQYWLLDRVKQQKTESSRNGKSAARTVDYTYDVLLGGAPMPSPRTVKRYRAPGDEGPTANTATLSYDGFGNVTQAATRDHASGEVRTACVAYAPDGVHPYAISNGMGHTQYQNFDPLLGLLVASIDANGQQTRRTYDALGRLRGVESDRGAWVQYGYLQQLEGNQKLTQVTTSTVGGSRYTLLDRMGRTVRERFIGFDKVVRESTRDYDSAGQLDAQHLFDRAAAAADKIQYSHDNRGRLVKQQGPDYVRSYSYDGLNTVYTDSLGHQTATLADAAGQATRITRGLGTPEEVAQSFSYGPFGQLSDAAVIGVAHSGRNHTWNELGQLTSTTDAETGLTSHTYNGFGERTSTTDANGRVSRTKYDAIGRPVTTTLFGADERADVVTAWAYSDGSTIPKGKARGRVSKVTRTDYLADPDGMVTSLEYFYDALGRSIATTQAVSVVGSVLPPETHTVAMEYDVAGRLRTLIYPLLPGQATPAKVTYEYATTGHLAKVIGPGNTALWTLEETDGQDRLTEFTSGDGTHTERLLAWNGAITDVGVYTAGVPLSYLHYTYDTEGNLKQRADLIRNQSETFTYDALDQLRSEQATGPGGISGNTLLYDYDKLGNFIHGLYAYDPARPTLQLTDAYGNTNAYDAVGNQTRRGVSTLTGSVQYLEYNDLNLPSRIQDPVGKILATFAYSPAGDRVRKVGNAKYTKGETLYALGLYERLKSTGSTPSIQHRLKVPGGSGLAAILHYVEQGGVAVPQPTLYPHTDHLGSTDTVTQRPEGDSDSAQVKTQRSYRSWGLLRSANDWSSPSPIALNVPSLSDGFTGHEDDADFGLTNMGGRVYDAISGRFLTPDPLARPASNGYAYVDNNPLRYVDPSGFTGECPSGQWCGGGGGSGGSGGNGSEGGGGGPPSIPNPEPSPPGGDGSGVCGPGGCEYPAGPMHNGGGNAGNGGPVACMPPECRPPNHSSGIPYVPPRPSDSPSPVSGTSVIPDAPGRVDGASGQKGLAGQGNGETWMRTWCGRGVPCKATAAQDSQRFIDNLGALEAFSGVYFGMTTLFTGATHVVDAVFAFGARSALAIGVGTPYIAQPPMTDIERNLATRWASGPAHNGVSLGNSWVHVGEEVMGTAASTPLMHAHEVEKLSRSNPFVIYLSGVHGWSDGSGISRAEPEFYEFAMRMTSHLSNVRVVNMGSRDWHTQLNYARIEAWGLGVQQPLVFCGWCMSFPLGVPPAP